MGIVDLEHFRNFSSNELLVGLINDNTGKDLIMIKAEIIFCLRAVPKGHN